MQSKILRFILNVAVVSSSIFLIIVILFFGLIKISKYNIDMQLEREYKNAQNNQKIELLEAKCTLLAAKFYADAERERARGTVEANDILCNAWQKLNILNESFKRYK